MNQIALHHGDSLDILRRVASNSFDSCVTDPPYLIGFMGRAWDKNGISYNVEFWREVLRVLKPGAHLLAFGGTRTSHRMVCAIEDAGFEIRDSLHWMYGQGFPKSLDVSKATSSAEWDGFGTAIKPAHEPIVLARKPLSEPTVAENVERWGCGGLNIGETRITHHEKIRIKKAQEGGNKVYGQAGRYKDTTELKPDGRYPSNVILSHSPSCNGSCVEDGSCAVRELDRQSAAIGIHGAGKARDAIRQCDPSGMWGMNGDGHRFGDSGGASRFYFIAEWDTEQDFIIPFFYCSKASKRDRGKDNSWPTVKPTSLMRYLCRLITPPGGHILEPFCGSGTTVVAAVREGFAVTAIDKDETAFEIAKRRVGAEREKIESTLFYHAEKEEKAEPVQPSLFSASQDSLC